MPFSSNQPSKAFSGKIRRGTPGSKKQRAPLLWAGSGAQASPAIKHKELTLVIILDTSGRLNNCPALLEDHLGRSRDSLVGTHLTDLVQSADGTSIKMALQRLLAGQSAGHFTAGLCHGNGSIVWMLLHLSLSPDKSSIVLEAMLADCPLSAAREVLPAHLVLNEIEEGILIVDATRDTLPVIDANPGFTQLSGYTHRETIGRPLRFLSDGNTNRESLDQTIAAALAGSRATAEIGLSRRDGSPLCIRLTLIPLPGADGRIERLLAIHLDVSERRIVFDALREKQSALTNALDLLHKNKEAIVQRERMHALGKMASGIVHDFNNLLAPILGFTELLLTFPPMMSDTARVSTYLQKIRTAASDGAAVVSRLREFYRSREEAEQPEDFSPSAAVTEILDLTRHHWKNEAQASGLEIRLEADLQDTAPVNGIVAEIRQAMTNLVLNAVDAMPGGGTLKLRTFEKGDWVCIEIGDTGTGMTPETRMRCFEPFFTTKGKCGTGLGLAIVLGIVERHRGRVELDSEPGKGTTFSLWLPASTAESSPALTSAPAQSANARALRILAVDDEELLLEVVSETLQGLGHTVTCFTDPTAALENFYNQRYDLVITDRAMPGMTGDMLARRIREYQPSIPVVLLTGFGNIITQSGEQPQNISEVISKPVSQRMLRNMLGRYGGSINQACA